MISLSVVEDDNVKTKPDTTAVQTRIAVPLKSYLRAQEVRAKFARQRGVRSVPLQELLLAGLDMLLDRDAAQGGEHG